MRKTITKISIYCSLFLMLAGAAIAQSSDTTFKPSGKLWGYAFGDIAYKGSADTVGSTSSVKQDGGRSGAPGSAINQYAHLAPNSNLFQFRRIYLGYDYNISQKFSAEFLLAAEDNWGSDRK